MHERCPVCGLKYDREPGYFPGRPVLQLRALDSPGTGNRPAPLALLHWPFDTVMFATFVAYLPFVPFVSRLARVMWIYMTAISIPIDP